MNSIPHFVRKTRITTTPTQLMLAVLSYAMKLNANKNKTVMRKTERKTVARVFGIIRLNFNSLSCLTEMEG